MFFNGWLSLGRTIVVGILAYAGLVIFLRFSGKRTLSKMNAFDLVVTVALGSTLSSVLLSQNISLAEGLTAFLTLIMLQFVVAWSAVRSKKFAHLVKAEPTLLFYQGEFLSGTMKSERVTSGEVLAAVRAQGLPSLQQVQAVVLETDGSFTVINTSSQNDPSALQHTRGPNSVERDIHERIEKNKPQAQS